MAKIVEFIVSIYRRVRLWGLKGVWGYFLSKMRSAAISRAFLDNARRYPMNPERGITILADMTNQSSLSKVMRDFAVALDKTGIPFQTFDLHPSNELPDADIGNILTPADQFRMLKYDHVVEMFSSPFPKSLPLKRSRIVFWEFTTGLLEYDPAVGNVQSVVAMSDFNRDVFRQMLPSSVSVHKVLYPFFFDGEDIPDKSDIRREYGIPEEAFVVLFNFDYGSSFNRKNPDGSIRAFAKAFSKNDGAVLVFKTKGAAQHQEERGMLVDMAARLGIGSRVVMIDDYIPQHDVYGLTNACDVYLSLHRGEGFALGVAEAMSLGKPVVVTNYSSTTEFCRPGNSIPVSCSVVKVPDDMHDHPCYHAVKEWAEPDINDAAAALCRLYAEPSLRREIGNAAKAFIEEYFSIENFRRSIEAFLYER